MLGREESTELLTPGVGRRKSSKTETAGGKKSGFSWLRSHLALGPQIWVKGAEVSCVLLTKTV